ncbi:hypothetical protein [Streptomyces sp. CA-132043]|uniref:hypothetical protein n=1 Tax=Streptomyces sp. CA-132043 TaxID=3240048 RepID=UPI003D94CDD7
MPVTPSGDEALHDAVLNYLYRLAMATGHPVRASVHDARSGFLTPIEVQTDGSSHFTGEPEQVAPPAAVPPRAAAPSPGPGPEPQVPEPQARPHPQQIDQQGDQQVDQRSARSAPAGPTAPQQAPQQAPHHIPQPTASAAHVAPPAQSVPAQQPAQQPVQPAPAPGNAAPGTIPPALAEAVSRINDAVRLGHLEFAASTANSALNSAVQEFGVGHPYVLHLQELFAHIAYLAHDTVKSMAIYLDVFDFRYRQHDPAAYDTFMRAAKVWFAIKEPQQAMRYGQQLVNTWVELARAGGPAAADGEKIEAAQKRLARLTQRSDAPGQAPA